MGEDFELGEILLILVAVLGLGYGLYVLLKKLIPGAGTPDAGGGAPAASALGSLLNQLDIGHSSSSYEDASSEVLANPISSIGTIVGGWWDDLTGANSPSLVAASSGTDDGTYNASLDNSGVF